MTNGESKGQLGPDSSFDKPLTDVKVFLQL